MKTIHKVNQNRMKSLIILALIFSSINLYSQDTPKYKKDGVAVHIGTGILYGGGIGTLVEYQHIIKDDFRITPLAGLGFSIGGAYPTDTINSEGKWMNYAIGFNIEYGTKHRLIVGP